MKSEAPARWRRVKIGEIAEVVGGGTPKTSDDGNFEGIIPWITPKDLSSHQGRYIERGERSISEKGLTSSSARLLPANAVLVSTRAPIGYCAIAKVPLATNQGFRSLVIKDGHSPEFFYYLVKANTPTLEAHASGSTFKELSGGTFKEIEFAIPPIEEQRRIAWVLGSLDDKIELNRRIAETLEQIVAAIFKARFVDFVGVEEFEESELGPIPKGWDIGALGDVLALKVRRIQPSDETRRRPYVPIDAIVSKRLMLESWKPGSEAKSSLVKFERGDILFGAMRPYFHKVCIAPFAGTTRTTVFVLVPKKPCYASFGALRLFQPDAIDYATRHSRGSTIPYAKWDGSLADMPIVIPPEDVLEEFERICNPLLNRLLNFTHEQRLLARIRDALLPKLISGQIRVPEGFGPDDAGEGAGELVVSDSQGLTETAPSAA